jgi:hypothetical protein
VLSDEYVELTADSLSKKLDELYPGKFWPRGQQANFVVNGPAPGQYLIKSTIPGAAGLFMLLSVPGRIRTSPALPASSLILSCDEGPKLNTAGCRSTSSARLQAMRMPIGSSVRRWPNWRRQMRRSWSSPMTTPPCC